jgi:hypothetical protein
LRKTGKTEQRHFFIDDDGESQDHGVFSDADLLRNNK